MKKLIVCFILAMTVALMPAAIAHHKEGHEKGGRPQASPSPAPSESPDSSGPAKGCEQAAENDGDSYDSTCDGSPSGNGEGDGEAEGKPCAGCVGSADNKNPGENSGNGQQPDGSDSNNGYECDGNSGVGKTNPAHTGCSSTPSPPPPPPSPSPSPPCVIPPGQIACDEDNVSPSPSPTPTPTPSCEPRPGEDENCVEIEKKCIELTTDVCSDDSSTRSSALPDTGVDPGLKMIAGSGLVLVGLGLLLWGMLFRPKSRRW